MSHSRCWRWLLIWLGGCFLLPAHATCTSPTSPLDATISPEMGSRQRIDLADAMAACERTFVTHLRCCPVSPAAALDDELFADSCAATECATNASCYQEMCDCFETIGVFMDDELWEYLGFVDAHLEIWPHICMLALATCFLVGGCFKRKKRKLRIKKRPCHKAHRQVSLIRTFGWCRFAGKQRVCSSRLRCRRRVVKRYLQRQAWKFCKPKAHFCPVDTKTEQTQNETWSHFSENYMNLMTSSRFNGGAAPKGVVPRRKRHKRNVSDENKMGELTGFFEEILEQRNFHGPTFDTYGQFSPTDECWPSLCDQNNQTEKTYET